MKNKNDELLNGLIASGYDFRFGDYFNSGMDIFKKNMGSFIGFGALVGGIIIVLSIIPYVGSLAGSLLQTVFVAGIYIVANDIVRNQTPDFNRFFAGFKFAGELILAQLVSGVLILIGVLLLIIPGIYLAISYSFTGFFIIFMNYGFWDAMEWSRRIVTKNFWPVFGFALVMGMINVAGALFCGLGLIFTIPFTACATYAAFENIISQTRTREEESKIRY